MRTFLAFILACSLGSAYAQEKFVLSGYVADEKGEMLPGVYVLVQQSTAGAVTNTYGFFSLTLPAAEYRIRFSYIGFETKEVEINLKQPVKLSVSLVPVTDAIDAVTITAQRKDENVKETAMSTVQLQSRTIRKIPNLMGEVDILKTIQLFPGVQTTVEGSSGFNVRGGNADQNLILLDGATVYNPSHLFGFFSVFNGDAVKHIELYKGGIPAEFGGRLSSVLDVSMNEGSMQQFKGSAGIGLISSRLAFDGPILKNKMSFALSARRTYADLMLPFATDSVSRNSKIYFYDLNAKVNYQLNANNRIFLSGYFGRDVNVLGNLYQMNFGNATTTIRWNHIFRDKLFSNLTLIYSDFNYNLGIPEGIMAFNWKSHILDYSLRNDYTWYLNPSNTIKFGLQITHHTIKPGSINGVGHSSDIPTLKYPHSRGIESALFISNEQKLGSRLSIVYGLRFSLFQNIGKGTLYHYDTEYNPTDSTVYGRGEIFNTFGNPEPRLNIRYSVSDRSSVKVSYNRTAQYLHLASNSTATFPLDMWFMSNPNVKPQVADQVAAGYFRNFSENTLETSLEVFYKEISNAIDFKDHAVLLPQKHLEGELRIGKAWSYGVEFLLRKQSGRLTGWLSYAYIRTFRKIPAINSGKSFNPTYDKPHNVSLVVNYEISKKFDVSANWVYSTAIPVTVPRQGYNFWNIWAPDYSYRGGVRIPGTAYHRLDLSLNYHFRTFKLESSLNLSVYNAYNRHNAFAVYFRDKNLDRESSGNESGIEVVKLYLFPIVPAITYNIKF